jgi:hypothetical protein
MAFSVLRQPIMFDMLAANSQVFCKEIIPKYVKLPIPGFAAGSYRFSTEELAMSILDGGVPGGNRFRKAPDKPIPMRSSVP